MPSDHLRQSYSWEDDDRVDRSRSYRVRRRLNADGDELVHTVNVELESPRSVEPLWDAPRRRRFPIAPTPPTVDDSYRERRRDGIRPDPEVIVFSRVGNSSDSEPYSVPINSRRTPSQRRGWGKVVTRTWSLNILIVVFITARLDPDGNEISTDEEEVLERARAIVRRENSHPLFDLLGPVIRESGDGTITSRGDTRSLEAQASSARSDPTNTTQPSDMTQDERQVRRSPGDCVSVPVC